MGRYQKNISLLYSVTVPIIAAFWSIQSVGRALINDLQLY